MDPSGRLSTPALPATSTLHHLAAVTVRGDPYDGLRRALRREHFLVPSEVPGLCWRRLALDRRGVEACYLFETGDAADAFGLEPVSSDPSLLRLVASWPGCSVQVAPVRHVHVPPGAIEAPIFVVSAPRAGSTLLFEILARSDTMWTPGGEANDIIEGIPALNPARRGFESHRLEARDADPVTGGLLRAALCLALIDRAGRHWLELGPSPAPVRVLEKTPENAFRVSFLAAAFPDSTFVLLVRDPLASISSAVEAWQHAGFLNIPDLPGWRRGDWHLPLPPGWSGCDPERLSEVAAYQWAAANTTALADLAGLSPERWTVVTYESLVAHADQTVRSLCRSLGIAVDPELARALGRPLPLSGTAITRPSERKWRYNRDLDVAALAGVGTAARAVDDVAGTRYTSVIP